MSRALRAKQRAVCAVLVTVMTLGSVGCVTTGPTAAVVTLTPAEQKLRADKTRFDNTVIGGVLKGAMIGAAIGGLGALLVGGNKNDAAKAAVVGAVAGGALGGMDGYGKAKMQQAKMNEVAALQSAADDVRKDNANLQAFLDGSATVLSEGKQRLSALKGDVDAKRITTAQAQTARKREEQNIAQMQAALKNAQETREQYAKASATFLANKPDAAAKKRDLDAEIARMNQNVAALERNINDYSRALAVSSA